MHPQAFDFVRRVVQSLPPLYSVVEFGSKNWNGTIRDIFQDAIQGDGSYLGIDLEPGDLVDLIADASTWRTYQKYSAVVCCEVLEHTPLAEAICLSARLALDRGGVFIMTCAGDGRNPHGRNGGELPHDEFYRNVSRSQIEEWLTAAGFDLILVSPSPDGDLYATAMLVR